MTQRQKNLQALILERLHWVDDELRHGSWTAIGSVRREDPGDALKHIAAVENHLKRAKGMLRSWVRSKP